MENRPFYTILGLSIVCYLINAFLPVMEIDSAQYAEMSREMWHSKSFLHIYDGGKDYLDKPPFLFWISSLSIGLFGANSFAFKLPSILFLMLSLWALYRFTALYYSKNIARQALLVLASCQAAMHMSNDVRTDTMLMAWNMLSFYFLSAWYLNQVKWKYLMAASICLAFGMMTKGMIALILPIVCFSILFLLQKKWSDFLKPSYVIVLVIIIILLLPMSYGLYSQFDLFPEKIVNGKTNMSGLRFFYWTQSFGRITGESEWNNHRPFYFLMQNMLWELLPYTLLFFLGFIVFARKFYSTKYLIPFLCGITIIIGYILLATSKYQLPHYIYIVFPFFCLVIAWYYNEYIQFQKKWMIFFFSLGLILMAAIFWLLMYSFGINSLPNYLFALMSIFIFCAAALHYYSQKISALHFTACMSISINLLLSGIFYPNILKYQTGNSLATFIKERNLDPEDIAAFQFNPGRSLDFYLNADIPMVDTLSDHSLFITDETGKNLLEESRKEMEILFEGNAHPVSTLSMKFLNPLTRVAQCEKYYLLNIVNSEN
ncbi:MAG: glycosyltransferase family 39 protein [Bacteroidota bacterium]|nr:glycosyltransferase family 39 protein [Bacteroidota bacterium]